jgi:tRNA-dihydrouridine synthase B
VFNFSKPLQLKNLRLENRVLLAPLAGVSDIPMRRMCQYMGAGLTYVEMLSATAIKYRNKRTFEMMARHKDEKVLGLQLTGSNAEDVAEAVEIIKKEAPWQFDTFDINMGCPVRKVVSAGCGSAILNDPERVAQTIKLTSQKLLECHTPLSAKIRIGYTRQNINATQICEIISKSSAEMITVHGRTRSEGYDTPVDLTEIKTAFAQFLETDENQRIKLIGNGDVFDFFSAQTMQNKTSADGVMVSRGALGNPWVFKEILENRKVNPTLQEWEEVVFEHIHLHEEHYGKLKNSAILLRKHLLWYSKGFPHMKVLRETFNHVSEIKEAREILKAYVCNHQKSLKRYENAQSSLEQEEFLKAQNSAHDPKYEMSRELDRGVGHLGL